MYLFFAPAFIAFVVIAIIYIKNDLNAFTARQLRFAAAHVCALVVIVLLFEGAIKLIGR